MMTTTMTTTRSIGTVWLGLALGFLMLSAPLGAATITVSTNKDNDTAPNDCTLRNAVQAAFEILRSAEERRPR